MEIEEIGFKTWSYQRLKQTIFGISKNSWRGYMGFVDQKNQIFKIKIIWFTRLSKKFKLLFLSI